MGEPRLSVIVATLGRDTLRRALQSAADQPLLPGDEVLVVGDGDHIERVAAEFGFRYIRCAAGGDFGYSERNYAMPFASGTHLLFLDDDDCYTPGAFDAIRRAIAANPERPLMFRMVAPWGQTLWVDPTVREANHGGAQFVVPNVADRLGTWGTRYEGDFDFCMSTLAHYPDGSLVWDETVIYVCRPAA
jgi:glycosyltransferase involved in cell wall biosynthesis